MQHFFCYHNYMIGIYGILNKTTKKIYIGQSVEVEERWKRHKRELTTHKHHNDLLQRHWNKYGAKDFDFLIIELLPNDRNVLNDRETFWKDYFDNLFGTFNLGHTGNCNNVSEATKEKIRKTLLGNPSPMKGKHHSEETKKLISERLKGKGRPHTPEEVEKIRKAMIGRTFTKETLTKISLARKGKKLSEEQRAKRIGMQAGEKNPFYHKHHTQETRELIRQKKLGKHLSMKTRKKISEGNKGKVGFWRGKKRPKEQIPLSIHYKKVNQFDLNKNFIRQWNSIKEASQKLNINENSIGRVCKKFRNKAGGYYWEYAN